MTPATFPALLAEQLRRDGSRPLVTFYDDATGERVELSVVTYANWVAKTAGLLQDELGVERGGLVRVDLPTHWLAPVWLGACWAVGAAVTAEPHADAELVVCGPDGLPEHARGGLAVVALSLLPMGARFATPLPEGVLDYGAVVWGQPDSFLPLDPPGRDDVAWRAGTTTLTQGQLASTPPPGQGTRLLTDLAPTSRPGLDALVGPLAAGGGTVWVRNAASDGWPARAAAEQASVVRRTQGPGSAQKGSGQPPRS